MLCEWDDDRRGQTDDDDRRKQGKDDAHDIKVPRVRLGSNGRERSADEQANVTTASPWATD